MTYRKLISSVLVLAVLGMASAGEAGRRHYRGHHHHRGHGGIGLGLGIGLVVGSLATGHWYRPSRPVYVVRNEPSYAYDGRGSIDTDVKPDTATVYLDGTPVGIADDFDGNPTRLYVSPGRHEVLFRENGYEALRVVVDVLPYHDLRIHERMSRAVAGYSSIAVEPQSDPVDLQRSRIPRGTATLTLEIDPSDATVYVDGRSHGGAREEARYLIALAPGRHRIEVVKPGYNVHERGGHVAAPGSGAACATRAGRAPVKLNAKTP